MYHNKGFLTIEASIALAATVSMVIMISQFQVLIAQISGQTKRYIQFVHDSRHLLTQAYLKSVSHYNQKAVYDTQSNEKPFFSKTVPCTIPEMPLTKPIHIYCICNKQEPAATEDEQPLLSAVGLVYEVHI